MQQKISRTTGGRSAQPSRTSAIERIVAPFSEVWCHRRLLTQTLVNAVRQKNAGSVLGLFWLVFTPLLFLGFYAAIYGAVFQVRPPDMTVTNYILLLMSGLLAFLGFSEGLSAGISALSNNRTILLNTVFPAHLIPVATVLAAQTSCVVGFGFVVPAALIAGQWSWSLLLVPLVLLLQIMFLTGMSWLLAPIRLVFPDLQNIVGFIVLLLAVGSPIAYTPEMVPSALKAIVYFNPLSYFVLPLQAIVVRGEMPPLHIAALSIGLSLAVYVGGYWWFKRISRTFADHV